MFPLPIVSRLLSVARYVSAFGLDAALEIGLGAWEGWERDFLFDGLVLVAEHERDARMIAQAALWRSLLSGRSSNG